MTMPGIVGTDMVTACGRHRDVPPNHPSGFFVLFCFVLFFVGWVYLGPSSALVCFVFSWSIVDS